MEVFLVKMLLVGISLMLYSSKVFVKSNAETIEFPENFLFGASSSAYQIEGGWDAGGKDPSIWDTFTHQNSELITDKSNGDVSADSYHFYMNDVDALKQIGVK